MRIIITAHARARIVERVGCSQKKIDKLVSKAWKYGTEPLQWFLKRRALHPHNVLTEYRVYMGGAFAFIPDEENPENRILTTCLVYNHETKPILPH